MRWCCITQSLDGCSPDNRYNLKFCLTTCGLFCAATVNVCHQRIACLCVLVYVKCYLCLQTVKKKNRQQYQMSKKTPSIVFNLEYFYCWRLNVIFLYFHSVSISKDLFSIRGFLLGFPLQLRASHAHAIWSPFFCVLCSCAIISIAPSQ